MCESVFSAPEKASSSQCFNLKYYTKSIDIPNQLLAPGINLATHSHVPPGRDLSIYVCQQLPLIPLDGLTTPSAISRINLWLFHFCQPGHVIYPVHLLVHLSFHLL